MRILLNRLLARPVLFAELLIATLLANLLGLAVPLFVIQVLNRYVTFGTDATLYTLAAGAGFAVVLEFGFRQVRQNLLAAANAGHDQALSERVFTIAARAKAGALGRLSPAARREILSAPDTVAQTLTPSTMATLLDVPFALLFVGAVMLLSIELGVIVLAVLAVAFLLSLAMAALLRVPQTQAQTVAARRSGLLGISVGNTDTVRAFNAYPLLAQHWQAATAQIQTLGDRMARHQGFLVSSGHFLQGVLGLLVIGAGALLIVHGELGVAAMIGANLLAARALAPVTRMGQLAPQLAKLGRAVSLVREAQKLPLEAAGGAAPGTFSGQVELSDVGFAYPEAAGPLFESVSLTLQPGSILFVFGRNGAGKTTTARLLAGILEPSRGQILLDGINLKQADPAWWRRQIAYVPQNPSFLPGTLGDNIRVNAPGLDADGLSALLEETGLARFVDESPEGLDTRLDANADTFSAGIRRKIALARALAPGYADGPQNLLIIDEPADGLDPSGRRLVMEAVNRRNKQGATTIVLTHDPELAAQAPVVLDLDSKPVPRLIKKQASPSGAGVTPLKPAGQAREA